MAATILKCKIVELSDADIIISFEDPLLDTEHGYYFCVVRVNPVDETPCRIVGVDAEQAADLARRFLIRRFQGLTITTLEGTPVDLLELFAA